MLARLISKAAIWSRAHPKLVKCKSQHRQSPKEQRHAVSQVLSVMQRLRLQHLLSQSKLWEAKAQRRSVLLARVNLKPGKLSKPKQQLPQTRRRMILQSQQEDQVLSLTSQLWSCLPILPQRVFGKESRTATESLRSRN